MLRITTFRATDLHLLDLKPGQRIEATAFGDPAQALEAAGNGFTVWLHENGQPRPLFCGGAIERHAEYATCWAAFAQDASQAAIYITKRARQFVRDLPHRRVDATVQPDLAGAKAWVEALGFTFEAELGAYFPDGSAALVFRR